MNKPVKQRLGLSGDNFRAAALDAEGELMQLSVRLRNLEDSAARLDKQLIADGLGWLERKRLMSEVKMMLNSLRSQLRLEEVALVRFRQAANSLES